MEIGVLCDFAKAYLLINNTIGAGFLSGLFMCSSPKRC